MLDSVVKEQLVKSFISTEAAHSTAASLSVKLFFDFVSGETSFYSTTCAFDPNLFSPAGGAFYSVQNRCQPPLSNRFRSIRSKHQQDQTTTLSTGSHSTRQIQLCKPFIQLNLLINKQFLKRFIAEVARILHQHGEL
ncbi:hypothetical protein [Ectopseudomonas oleovorans]|uniref:hypothetical protein n=1 Tax=Ectopseudomonas oleovorans TaxID=301 RepID=UPI002010CFCF|nr:hypothetical protein [Pseudomonas oleovorans]